MQRLIGRKMALTPSASLVLSTAYSLSSVIIAVSSYTCAMNIAVLMPLFLETVITFITDKRTVTSGIISSFAYALLVWASGPFCYLCVIPFVLFACLWCSFLVTNSLPSGFKRALSVIPYLLLGTVLSAGSILNTLRNRELAIITDDLETFEFRTTFFDFLVGFEGVCR